MYEKQIKNSIGETSPFIKDKVRISLTNCCNRRCFYCHNEGQGHTKESQYLKPGFVKEFCDYCFRGNYRIKKLNITGGEPLLHPQLEEIVAELAKVSDSIRINTNALLLDKDRIDRLINLGIKEFKIGVDSFWNDDCNEIKNDNYNHITSVIRYIREKGCSVVLNMVATRYNIDIIDDMVECCQKNGVSHLKIIEQIDYNFFDDLEYQRSSLNGYYSAYEKYRRECVRFVPDVDIGMDDMYLQSGLKIRWCESYCKTRACGTMYTIINTEGEIVNCSKSSKSQRIDFSPSRSVSEIDADIKRAQEEICCVNGKRYLRDIDGVLLGEDYRKPHQWKWESETKEYWKTPEPIVYSLINRWKNKGKDLLDLGCGMGRNAFVFAENGFNTIAIDSSSFAIQNVLKKNANNLTAYCMDMCRLEIPNDSVDFLFSFNVISHSDDYLISLVIREIYRVLRINGEAWISVCSKESDNWKDMESPLIQEHTKLKRRKGAEFGVAHYYADIADIHFLFREFDIIDIQHINHCFYDGKRQNSWHFQVLIRKPDKQYKVPLCSRGE